MKQYRLSPILDAYDAVLFDMDGVMTSEQMYWSAAALTVYEMYHGAHYYGSKPLSAQELAEEWKQIRRTVFCNDRTIRLVKDKGVNSNWDLAYVVLGCALWLDEVSDFDAVYDALSSIGGDAFSLYDAVAARLSAKFEQKPGYFDRLGPFWQQTVSCFQEWFLGSALYQKQFGQPARLSGKPGLIHAEEPIVDKPLLLSLLKLLHDSGKRIGIGTGRPLLECESVLIHWDVQKYFEPDAVITYDDVLAAENRLLQTGISVELTKPHPFIFLKGCLGGKFTDEEIVRGHFDPSPCRRTLVVGDAGADLFAARAAGCGFAAVLTGVQGQDAHEFFEKEKADFILNNVLDFMMEIQ